MQRFIDSENRCEKLSSINRCYQISVTHESCNDVTQSLFVLLPYCDRTLGPIIKYGYYTFFTMKNTIHVHIMHMVALWFGHHFSICVSYVFYREKNAIPRYNTYGCIMSGTTPLSVMHLYCLLSNTGWMLVNYEQFEGKFCLCCCIS